MTFDGYTLIGLLGVALALYAYGRVQWQRDYAKTLSYSLLNLCNAILLLISLSKDWNFAAVVSNIIWGLFSLYGIYRCLKYQGRRQTLRR